MAKVNKKTQEKTRRLLIEAAIALMIEKGFEKTTMREIARRAKVGDATIYNYFPTKDQLLFAYLRLRHQQAIDTVNAISDFKNFTLQEQLHTYFETILEQFLPDREFMPTLIQLTHKSILSHQSELQALHQLFVGQVRMMLTQAIERKEIPDQPIELLIPHLLLDVYLMLVLYWLKDDSEGFTRTTQVLDQVLGIAVSILKEGLIGKMVHLGQFLFRQHMMRFFGLGCVLEPLQTLRNEWR